MTELTTPRISTDSQTSPIYRIKGQRSRWRYGDQRLTPEHCEILRDVNISERGSAEARYGSVLYNSTQLPGGEQAVGLWQGKFASGDTRNVVVTPSAIYVDDGTTRTVITGVALAGGNDDRIDFVFSKDQLLINNTIDDLRTWNGQLATTTSDLTTVPFTKAQSMILHKNLVLVFGTTEGGTYQPTRVRWCDIDRRVHTVDVNTWPDANRYEIYDGGTRIVGAAENWGVCLVFKEDGLYPGEIFYDQLGHFDFRLGQPTRGFSPISRKGIIARPEFVYVAAREGIAVIRPDLSFELINSDDTDEWFGFNQGRLQYTQAFIRERDHQVRLLVSSSSNTGGHDRELVWDWETGDIWQDIPTNKKSVAERIVVSNEELDWFCGVNGFLYQGNKSTYKDDSGTGFDWRIKMSPNDVGFPGRSKHFLNIKTLFRKRAGQQTATLKAHVDEGRQGAVSGTLSFAAEYKWNTGVKWNTGKKWPGSRARIADLEINRIGETIAPEWTGSNPAGIEGYQVEFILLE